MCRKPDVTSRHQPPPATWIGARAAAANSDPEALSATLPALITVSTKTATLIAIRVGTTTGVRSAGPRRPGRRCARPPRRSRRTASRRAPRAGTAGTPAGRSGCSAGRWAGRDGGRRRGSAPGEADRPPGTLMPPLSGPSGDGVVGSGHRSAYSPETSTVSITMSDTGRSPGPVGAAAIASTTSREDWSATSPKMVCLRLSHVVGATVMKNCEPLVPGPAFAIASRYGPVEAQVRVELVGELVARSAATRSGGIAGLEHEAGDDAVEDGAVVERPARGTLRVRLAVLALARRQSHEVRHGLGRLVGEQVDGDVAVRGVQRRGRPVLGIRHGRTSCHRRSSGCDAPAGRALAGKGMAA